MDSITGQFTNEENTPDSSPKFEPTAINDCQPHRSPGISKMNPSYQMCPFEPIIERQGGSNIIHVKFRERQSAPKSENLVQALLNGFSPHLIPPYDSKDMKMTTGEQESYASTFAHSLRTIEKIPNPMCEEDLEQPTVSSSTIDANGVPELNETCQFSKSEDNTEDIQVVEIRSMPHIGMDGTEQETTWSTQNMNTPRGNNRSPIKNNCATTYKQDADSDDGDGLVIDEDPKCNPSFSSNHQETNAPTTSVSTSIISSSHYINNRRNILLPFDNAKKGLKDHKLTPRQLRAVIALYTAPKDGFSAFKMGNRRLCWLCLEFIPNSRVDYTRHFIKFHPVEPTYEVVACPYCEQYFDFHQGINQHILSAHFSQIKVDGKDESEELRKQDGVPTTTMVRSYGYKYGDNLSTTIHSKMSSLKYSPGDSISVSVHEKRKYGGKYISSSSTCGGSVSILSADSLEKNKYYQGVVSPPFQYNGGKVTYENKQVRASVIMSPMAEEQSTHRNRLSVKFPEPSAGEVALARAIASGFDSSHSSPTPQNMRLESTNHSVKRRILMKTRMETEELNKMANESYGAQLSYNSGVDSSNRQFKAAMSPFLVSSGQEFSAGCSSSEVASIPVQRQPIAFENYGYGNRSQQHKFHALVNYPTVEEARMNGGFEKYFKNGEMSLHRSRHRRKGKDGTYKDFKKKSRNLLNPNYEHVVVKNPFDEVPLPSSNFGGLPYTTSAAANGQNGYGSHSSNFLHPSRVQAMNTYESIWFATEPNRGQEEYLRIQNSSSPQMPLNMSMNRLNNTFRIQYNMKWKY